MLHRVIIAAGGDSECPNGTYVVTGRTDDRGLPILTLATLVEAEELRDRMAHTFPNVT